MNAVGISKPIVIFGTGELGRLVFTYLRHDPGRSVVAWCEDRECMRSQELLGLPIVAHDELSIVHPPGTVEILNTIGYRELNARRAAVYGMYKEFGYGFASYISPSTVMEAPDTVTLGENLIMLENNVIQPYAVIGNNVIIWAKSLVSHHVVVEDNCFIASGVMIGGGARIGDSSFLGMNVTVREGISVGHRNVVSAGMTLLNNTNAQDVFMSNHPEPLRGLPVSVLHKMLVS